MPQRHRTRISSHCIARWQERVDTNSTSSEARKAVEEIIRYGRRISSAHGWTARIAKRMGQGTAIVVWSGRPDVAILIQVRARVAMTVLPRKGWSRDKPNDPARIGMDCPSEPSPPARGRARAAATTTSIGETP